MVQRRRCHQADAFRNAKHFFAIKLYRTNTIRCAPDLEHFPSGAVSLSQKYHGAPAKRSCTVYTDSFALNFSRRSHTHTHIHLEWIHSIPPSHFPSRPLTLANSLYPSLSLFLPLFPILSLSLPFLCCIFCRSCVFHFHFPSFFCRRRRRRGFKMRCAKRLESESNLSVNHFP